MKKKLSYVIGIVFAVFMFLNFINGNKSEASTPVNPPIYMGVQEYRTDTDPANMAYGIGNPDRNGSDDSSMVGKKIWDLVEYASAGSPTFDNSKNYYCVKADVGFRNINDRATYNLSYDLVNEKSEIQSSSNTYIKDMVNDDDIYYGLLALVDMLYLPGVSETSEKTELINAALTTAGIPTDRYTVEITDTDIEAIQQAAVWYFTEQNDELFATIYNQLGYQNTSWFTYKLQSMSEYKSFSDYNLTESTRDGEQRQLQAVYIYNYLINTAKANAIEYKNGTMKPKSKITLYINSGDMEQQPVIIIDRIPEEFDLSLRKYITKVDGQEVANTRVPNIDTTPLVNETDTTATYNHRKDPVVVKTGSIVTYNITVYNEGEIDGYVNEIKDQLPEGLRYVSMTPDANYTASYDETQNVVTIRRNDTVPQSTEDGLLSAYDEGDTLDSITFEIQCEVTSVTNNDILTNVACIIEEQTADGTIIEQGIEDRDSEPSETPDVNQTNMYNYTGNTQNKPDLGDPNYFYKGEQDDDDFEKLIVQLEGNYQVQIEKVDKDNTDTKLAGAEFEVTLPGQSARPVSTGSNGIVDLGTVQITNVGTTDTITVKETKAPDGYNAILGTMTIQVEKELSNGSYVAKSATITSGAVEGTTVRVENGIVKIQVANTKKGFDLSLRKYISKVNDTIQNRVPVPDISGLQSGSSTTAVYNHSKQPLSVKVNDKITYTIRVYNEGELDGYANEITDYLPAELEFVEDDPINRQYEWVLGEDGRTVTTDYLSKEKETEERVNLIKAFDGTTLDYKDVQIVCKIKEGTITNIELTNIAEITEEVDENGNPVEDIDSDEDNVNIPSDEDLPGYKDDELDKEYVPGQEDDDDFEKIIVKEFDLALRKFITGVNEEEVTSRIPEVNYDAESDQITYEHDKTPVEVTTNDIVTYTIRIFNEGDLSGYAEEVADDIPEGLEFLPENEINQEYRWIMYDAEGNVTEDVSQAERVVTDYLSMANGESMMEADETLTENPNLLQPFDKTAEISETNPDYKDVQIAFRVIEPATSDRILTNSAQIEEDADENGEPVEDIDSTPGEWNDGEDDQDQEHLELTYFDLALRKWVTQAIVIENGKETITQTGHTAEMDPEPVVKVELNRHNLDNIEVKFRYSIRITNEGEIAGYAKEITDYVPEGLMFVAEDNPGWTDEGNNVISTRLLENTLLQPGESAEVEVLLTWIKGEDNLGLKTNVAEISEDDNDKGYDDIDSTPDNREEGEDDIDDAEVLLSISTGRAKIYIGLGLTVLITLGGGIALIKKFVL